MDETLVRADRRHIANMVALMGMEKAKAAATPSLDSKADEDNPELDNEGYSIFRSCVGIALHLAGDRWDIQRDVQILARAVQRPTVHDRKRLVKLVRYLKGTYDHGHRLGAPIHGKAGEAVLDMFSDSDFAGCPETRRATSCGVFYVDGVAVHMFSRRQGVQSTSSTEAELYAAGSTCFEGRLLKHFLERAGFLVLYRLHVDSSSAKAVMARDGVGKIKHLDVRVLWLQAEREHHDLVVLKVPGDRNPSDLGTKSHAQKRFEMLRELVGIKCCKEIDNYSPASVNSIEYPSLWRICSAPTSSKSLMLKLALLSACALQTAGQVILELDSEELKTNAAEDRVRGASVEEYIEATMRKIKFAVLFCFTASLATFLAIAFFIRASTNERESTHRLAAEPEQEPNADMTPVAPSPEDMGIPQALLPEPSSDEELWPAGPCGAADPFGRRRSPPPLWTRSKQSSVETQTPRPPSRRDARTQSQCTYTSVRGNAAPRFQWLQMGRGWGLARVICVKAGKVTS